jgi:hypothetical protein
MARQGGSPTIPNGRARVNLNNRNGNVLCNSLKAAYGTA